MSNYLIINPVNPEDGLDYIFAKMSAIYGQTFLRHWTDVDANIMRQVWTEELGNYLKSKSTLDKALKKMNGDFPPSAIKFRELCKESTDIFDLTTRIGIDKLAQECLMSEWDEMEHWHLYKERVIKIAKSMNIISEVNL